MRTAKKINEAWNDLADITKQIYLYLSTNCIGASNKATAQELMSIFGIDYDCALRKNIRNIRDTGLIICSKAGRNDNGYWVPIDAKDRFENLKKQKRRYLNGLKRVSIQDKEPLWNQLRFWK